MKVFYLLKNLKWYLKVNENFNVLVVFNILFIVKKKYKIIRKNNDFEGKWVKVMNRWFKKEKK